MSGRTQTIDELAVFGGRPLFESPRPTAQLYAPDRAVFMDRLKGILEQRRFSNGGHMQEELERRLAEAHGVRHVVAFANASLALVALIREFADDGAPDVLLPSFSYRGLPHLIQWAGKRPWFSDVDLVSHTLSAEALEGAVATSRGVAAILAVNHVTGPADIEGLDAISGRLGVPVIYDSVYAICAEYGGEPFGGNGIAEVFSLHATKLINGFEGGYVTTNDDGVAGALTAMRNFGYEANNPRIGLLGMNGKLNEVHAAMALGSLEHADELVERNTTVFETYRASIAGIPGLRVVDPAAAMTSNHEMVLMRVDPDGGIDRDTLLAVLKAEGAFARPYFSPPLHLSVHCPSDVEAGPLPHSEALSREFIQLPTGAFLATEDQHRLAELLAYAVSHSAQITERLNQLRVEP